MQLTFKLYNGEVLKFNVDKKVIIVGRSSQCDVVIPHEGMSRKHCQIELKGSSIIVTDLQSTNGVFIDGAKIEPGKPTPYPSYLGLSFGYVQSLQIEIEDSDGGTSPHITPLEKEPSLSQATRSHPTKPFTSQPKSKKQETDQRKYVPFIVIGLFAALVYWFLNREA